MINEQGELLCDDCLTPTTYCLCCKICGQHVCETCCTEHTTAADDTIKCRYADVPQWWRPVGY